MRFLSTVISVIFSAAVFSFSVFITPLNAQKMRVAVMNFNATGVTRTLANNVSELIRNEMINAGKYSVIERAQVNQILKEQGLQMSGCTDISCAVQIGKILSASKILIGTVMKMGDMIIISGRIVDVATGTGEYSAKESAQKEDDLYIAVTRFIQKLTLRTQGISPETAQFDMSGGIAAVRTEKNVYAANEPIIVFYSNLPGNSSDWITVVKASEPPESYGECPYTKGERSGKMQFKGLEPGDYEVRVFYNWDETGTYDIQLKHSFKIK